MCRGQPGVKETLTVKYLDISASYMISDKCELCVNAIPVLSPVKTKILLLLEKKVSLCTPAVSSVLLASSGLEHVHMLADCREE